MAGTPVQMADGTTKPVEQVKEGDLVLSKDEITGIISAKRVTGTSTRTVPVVETVNLADETGKIVESLTVTGDHPFYVEGQGFLAASQLPVGIKVEAKTGTLTVSSTERHETAQGFVVHNFTVEDDHSYFVGNASGGAWVHNGTITCAEIAKAMEESGLTPTQGHLYADKLEALVNDIKANGFKAPDARNPLILDPNGNIVSGHHRFVAAILAGKKIPEEFIRRLPTATNRALHTWGGISLR